MRRNLVVILVPPGVLLLLLLPLLEAFKAKSDSVETGDWPDTWLVLITRKLLPLALGQALLRVMTDLVEPRMVSGKLLVSKGFARKQLLVVEMVVVEMALVLFNGLSAFEWSARFAD